MKPVITLVRVRHDGIPAVTDSPLMRQCRQECGGEADYQELPYPVSHSARDFALDFLDAVARARGEWIYVASDLARHDQGALVEALRRLKAADPQGAQGLVFAARTRLPAGGEGSLFTEGFTLDAVETGKSVHPWLSDPSWLLSFFVLKASLARSLAEDLVRTVDPVPSVLSFTLAFRLSALVHQGVVLEDRSARLAIEGAPEPNTLADRAMAAFGAERSEEALGTLDYIRFAWGSNPGIDLHRAVLNAKLERYWLATFTVRRFLQKNKGNAPGLKLAEALASRKSQTRTGYQAALSLLDLVDPAGAFEGEKQLFETVNSLHEQAVILELGDFPLRSSAAMALACLGTPKKLVTLSPFRSSGGAKAAWGRGMDAWKAAMNRFDLEDNTEASESVRERLAGWGDAPRPDLVYVSLRGDRGIGPDELAAAFVLLKEGGLLAVEGASAENPEAWRFWVESAEPALEDRRREGTVSYGRKTHLPLGGAKPPLRFPELWRRTRLPEPFERTMLTFERFRNAFTVARAADIRKLPGAIVECGVWKGGCSSSMLLGAQQTGSKRALWAFDSFQGLPRPTEKDGSWAFTKSDEWGGAGCEATEEDFRETLFKIAGLKDENVHIRKGWFQDTLPTAKHEIGPIAILRLDGDWYESVLVCLEHLYDQVVPGGYILIDDYGYWEGARKATDEFRAKRGIRSPLIQTDHDERYWVKVEEKESWKPGQPVRDFATKNEGGSGAA